MADGQTLLSPSSAAKLLHECESMPASTASAGESVTPSLASGEVAVLRGAVDAKSHSEVAADLGISENTVKNHLRDALGKLHLHTRARAARDGAEGATDR